MEFEAKSFVFGQCIEPKWFTDYEHKTVVKMGSFQTAYVYNKNNTKQCRRFVDNDVIEYGDLYEW